MATTTAPLSAASTIDEILHGLLFGLMSAAAIFIKNEKSQANAAAYINLANTLLPVADAVLNPPA